MTNVRYDRARLRGRCQGIRAATCFGNARFRRDVLDQDFIDTLESALRDELHSAKQDRFSSRDQPSLHHWWCLQKARFRIFLFCLWSLTDYGRSIPRVTLIGFSLASLFGLVYALSPGMLKYDEGLALWWYTPFYYSIVTYTTLGFGDVTPITKTAQVLVTAEVICGYVTLGLLLSILANKFARRA